MKNLILSILAIVAIGFLTSSLINGSSQQKDEVTPDVLVGGPLAPDAMPILEYFNEEQVPLTGIRNVSNALKPNGIEMKLDVAPPTPEIQAMRNNSGQGEIQSTLPFQPYVPEEKVKASEVTPDILKAENITAITNILSTLNDNSIRYPVINLIAAAAGLS